MNISLLALRLIHVAAGALWVGAAVSYMFFVKPSARAIGPAEPDFMRNLMERRRYPLFMIAASLLAVLSGVLLYTTAWGGFRLSLFGSGPGVGFAVGSLAALMAFFVGTFGISPTAGRMSALGKQVAAAGVPPTPAQLTAMRTMEGRLIWFERIDFIMLMIALAAMATARYWTL